MCVKSLEFLFNPLREWLLFKPLSIKPVSVESQLLYFSALVRDQTVNLSVKEQRVFCQRVLVSTEDGKLSVLTQKSTQHCCIKRHPAGQNKTWDGHHASLQPATVDSQTGVFPTWGRVRGQVGGERAQGPGQKGSWG